MLMLTEIYLTVNDVQKNFINNYTYYFSYHIRKCRTLQAVSGFFLFPLAACPKTPENMESRFGIWYHLVNKTTMEDAGMGYIQGADRNQVILLPDTLDDYVRPLKNILFFRFKFQIHTKNPPGSIILVDFL